MKRFENLFPENENLNKLSVGGKNYIYVTDQELSKFRVDRVKAVGSIAVTMPFQYSQFLPATSFLRACQRSKIISRTELHQKQMKKWLKNARI